MRAKEPFTARHRVCRCGTRCDGSSNQADQNTRFHDKAGFAAYAGLDFHSDDALKQAARHLALHQPNLSPLSSTERRASN
jgi:hypothetical protein